MMIIGIQNIVLFGWQCLGCAVSFLFPCVSSFHLRYQNLGGVSRRRHCSGHSHPHNLRLGAEAPEPARWRRRTRGGAAREPAEGPHRLVRGAPGPQPKPAGFWMLAPAYGDLGAVVVWLLWLFEAPVFPIGFTLGLQPPKRERGAELVRNIFRVLLDRQISLLQNDVHIHICDFY